MLPSPLLSEEVISLENQRLVEIANRVQQVITTTIQIIYFGVMTPILALIMGRVITVIQVIVVRVVVVTTVVMAVIPEAVTLVFNSVESVQK